MPRFTITESVHSNHSTVLNRHPQNSNLLLWYESNYRDLPVYLGRGPLVTQYLESLLHVTQLSLQDYPRVFAFRVDLRFPSRQCHPLWGGNQVLERFIASFKAKINHCRSKARENNAYAPASKVRYAWCRELGQHGIPHYHMGFFLNYEAFFTIGRYELGLNNIFNRLHEAWASALGIPLKSIGGLVEVPENPSYLVRKDDWQSVANLFFRLSYLCKADTKVYGDGLHAFGTSRG